jgi:aspartate/methionine/tyrosine aminotransferase
MGRLEVIADTYLSVATPVQLALPEILARRAPVQAALRARTARNLAAVDAAIAAAGEHAPVRRLPADGGWYAVLEVPRTRDEDAWVELLAREDGVIVHPGYFFDFAEEGTLVVSLLPEEEPFREGIGRAMRRLAAA